MSRCAAATVLLTVLALVGCADEEAVPEPLRAPTRPRAAWVLEPTRIGVGQTSTLELAVVTPPGFVLRPYAPPPLPTGLWLLDAETPPVEKTEARWIHRTRLRLRANETGEHLWPGGQVDLEAPDGTPVALALPEHPVEVVSILPEYPDQVTPFGAREPPELRSESGPIWGPAAVGALAALALVGLVALAKRRKQAAHEESAVPVAPTGPAPWEQAREELALARSQAQEAPFEAAHLLSLGLRRFAERRFGADAAGRTLEELRATEPPFATRSRWPALLELLGELDAQRFRRSDDAEVRSVLAARLEALIEDGTRFVEDAVPPEARG